MGAHVVPQVALVRQQKIQANKRKELTKRLLPGAEVKADPVGDGVQKSALRVNIQRIAVDDRLHELWIVESKKLVRLAQFGEVSPSVLERLLNQNLARVDVGKGENFKTVAEIEMSLHEVAAGQDDVCHL